MNLTANEKKAATARQRRYVLLLAVMLVQLFIATGAGYLLRPLVGGSQSRYLPFLTATFEGGMMAYPLYMALC